MSQNTTSAPDRGQAAIVVVVATAALLVAIAAGLAAVAGTVSERAQAQTAADAAALASFDGGRSAAERLARANGATLVAWRRGPGPDEVTVTVRIGRVSASARATDRVGVPSGGP